MFFVCMLGCPVVYCATASSTRIESGSSLTIQGLLKLRNVSNSMQPKGGRAILGHPWSDNVVFHQILGNAIAVDFVKIFLNNFHLNKGLNISLGGRKDSSKFIHNFEWKTQEKNCTSCAIFREIFQIFWLANWMNWRDDDKFENSN